MKIKRRHFTSVTFWNTHNDSAGTRENIRKQALEILDAYGTIYSLLYDGKIRCNQFDAIERGDAWISENSTTPLFKAIMDIRCDVFASDREVCALALALGL